ncbi:hypothetical protein PL79_027530 [Burkholderia sp. USMB20]|nr:hypothetical protein PL79_027530 [Burkholderia sp. USMB20]
MSRPLFQLGQVVATRAVAAHLEQHRIAAALYLDRHVHGDWGSVPAEDARADAEPELVPVGSGDFRLG